MISNSSPFLRGLGLAFLLSLVDTLIEAYEKNFKIGKNIEFGIAFGINKKKKYIRDNLIIGEAGSLNKMKLSKKFPYFIHVHPRIEGYFSSHPSIADCSFVGCRNKMWHFVLDLSRSKHFLWAYSCHESIHENTIDELTVHFSRLLDLPPSTALAHYRGLVECMFIPISIYCYKLCFTNSKAVGIVDIETLTDSDEEYYDVTYGFKSDGASC